MVVVLSILFESAMLVWMGLNLVVQNGGAATNISGNPSEPWAVLNGDFEKGRLGWDNPHAIQIESNGNHYLINNNSWSVRQSLLLEPGGTYIFEASTKKGSASGPARITFVFYDTAGNKLPQYVDLLHTHHSDGWEDIPPQNIPVPANTATARVYLLADSEAGYHCFDNLKLSPTSATEQVPPKTEIPGEAQVDRDGAAAPGVKQEDTDLKTSAPEEQTKKEDSAAVEKESTSGVEQSTAIQYTVQKGDNLSAIALQFGVDLQELITTNNLANPNFIFEGQIIDIPQ
ncbi:MAG TPA: LysM peptidoglycan-binding domain-containing protein [Desulfotomaculum sp.]|nr:MAG: hypothetical protein VR67_10795 [Peptococcaceae bacterium BRH_c8a]KJS71822.1 MAG: hypothetical protein JL56_14155 [Desulfotomaculum sp. BICA1-6]HBX23870.1 LysM peptidoglycan-binding domain-containing protein [Desulfotomaculum sp.]